jgi:hypothetical protein
MCARVAHRRLCRLFHNVAELAGERQVAAAAGERGLDWGPRLGGGQAGRWQRRSRGAPVPVQARTGAKKAMQVPLITRSTRLCLRRVCARPCGRSRRLSFEIAQAGFLGVLGDDA